MSFVKFHGIVFLDKSVDIFYISTGACILQMVLLLLFEEGQKFKYLAMCSIVNSCIFFRSHWKTKNVVPENITLSF